MSFNFISAAEAASLVKHGYNIGLSGFTPAGTPKAVTAEIAKIAEEEHANPADAGPAGPEGRHLDGVWPGDRHPPRRARDCQWGL